MKRSLSEDLTGSLGDVSRGYIRKPATICLSIMLFFVAIPLGIIEALRMLWYDFTVKCWIGNDNV